VTAGTDPSQSHRLPTVQRRPAKDRTPPVAAGLAAVFSSTRTTRLVPGIAPRSAEPRPSENLTDSVTFIGDRVERKPLRSGLESGGSRADAVRGTNHLGRTLTTTIFSKPIATSAFYRSRAALRELPLIAVSYAFYAWIRGQVGSATSPADQAHALRDAQQLVSLERQLGLFHEPGLEHAVLGWTWLVKALDTFWSYGYLVVTAAVIVWLLVRDVDRFGPLPTAFFLSTIVALGLFVAFPTVPPRLLPPSYGMVDTWSAVGGIAARTPPRIEHISDPFAAMPSLHVAWAIWCALAVGMASRRRWARALAWAYPTLTIFAVVTTGNHYILDCAAGIVLMLGATWLVSALGRVRAGFSAGGSKRVVLVRPVGAGEPAAQSLLGGRSASSRDGQEPGVEATG
jgi:hypothetical protein